MRRGRRRPADRLVIVHTSGSTSVPEGRHPRSWPAAPPPRQPQRDPRRCRRHEVLFSNSPFFWIGGLAYDCSAPWSRAPRSCARNATTRPRRSTSSSGSARRWSTASRPRLPTSADPSFAGRDLSSIRRGNLYPIMPDASARRSGAAPQHARDDRGRQRLPGERRRERSARAPARLVRSPVPGLRGAGRRSRYRCAASRSARSASCGSAARS